MCHDYWKLVCLQIILFKWCLKLNYCLLPPNLLLCIINTFYVLISDVCDVEVEELTSHCPSNAIVDPFKFSSVSDSEIPSFLKPPCEKLSSESVKQFMKQVNRIRFTSMTGERDVDNFLMQDRSQSIYRSRSCPNLFVTAHSMETSLESKSISSASGKVDTKLVQVENAATQTEDPNLISSFTDDQSLSNMSEQHTELFNLYHFLLSPSPFSLCLKCKKPIDAPAEPEDPPVQPGKFFGGVLCV